MSGIKIDRCPACNGSHGSKLVALDTDRRQRFIEFDRLKYRGLMAGWIDACPPEILRCSVCGHCWYRYQPSPEQLDCMYAAGVPLESGGGVYREPTAFMLREMRRLCSLIDKPTPLLLDYGSGRGRWARAAARVGFRVHAYEPSETRGAESVEEFTLVHDLAEIAGMRFDVINLEQVLEHVPDPMETLQIIMAFCAANTVLRIRVPNILRPPEGTKVWADWPYDGKRVHAMAPFEHLHGFTPSSLVNLISRAGYEHLPLKNIWRNNPNLLIRKLIGKLYPKAVQTMVLAKLIN